MLRPLTFFGILLLREVSRSLASRAVGGLATPAHVDELAVLSLGPFDSGDLVRFLSLTSFTLALVSPMKSLTSRTRVVISSIV